jgi:NADPH:quinone reductase-like Zn-dependent oxidoreductase
MTSPFVGQSLKPLAAKDTAADLSVLADLIDAGTITPLIDRTFVLETAADAIRYLEQGHASGKIVVSV